MVYMVRSTSGATLIENVNHFFSVLALFRGSYIVYSSVNRFAGSRLEDLQGEIPALCKDQHGCRYLQKKLEEGVPEHRDMIFRETFGHFPELMIGMYLRGPSDSFFY
jgi:hypothetical protein